MTTYLLDTSVIIDVLNGKRDREALLKGLLSQGDMLACCAVNISEVYAGMRPKEEAKTEALLQSLDYYEINWEVAKRAGLLKRDYSKKGQTRGQAGIAGPSSAMAQATLRLLPGQTWRLDEVPGPPL